MLVLNRQAAERSFEQNAQSERLFKSRILPLVWSDNDKTARSNLCLQLWPVQERG
jgi:hypothetical protein